GPTWPRLNHRFDYAKFNEFGASTSKTTQAQTERGRVHNSPKPGPRTRWLAVSRVRFHGRPGGPSHETQEPARWRCDAQLDYALRRLSWQMSRGAVTIWCTRGFSLPLQSRVERWKKRTSWRQRVKL